MEKHLGRCGELRQIGDWKSALREADAAIAAGADSCPLVKIPTLLALNFLLVEGKLECSRLILVASLQLIALRAEALLQLHQINEAESTLSSLPKIETSSSSCSQSKSFGMIPDSYVYIVQAQVEMALGR